MAELNEKCEAMMNQLDITAETQVLMDYLDLLNIVYNLVDTGKYVYFVLLNIIIIISEV